MWSGRSANRTSFCPPETFRLAVLITTFIRTACWAVLDINNVPLKMVGQNPVRVSDIGGGDAPLQYNGSCERSTIGLPVYSETGWGFQHDCRCRRNPKQVEETRRYSRFTQTSVVFDQSEFVKSAIETLLHEGALGRSDIIDDYLPGSIRATLSLFSIPLSALATFLVRDRRQLINTMV